MSASTEEGAAARRRYTWDYVARDIALATSYTAMEAVRFTGMVRGGRGFQTMKDVGVHPYDMVEWVVEFWRYGGRAEPEILANLITLVFEAGKDAPK